MVFMMEQSLATLSVGTAIPMAIVAFTLIFAAIAAQLMQTGDRELRSIRRFSLLLAIHYALFIPVFLHTPGPEVRYGFALAIAAIIFPLLRLSAIRGFFHLPIQFPILAGFAIASLLVQLIPLLAPGSQSIFYYATTIPDIISNLYICLLIARIGYRQALFGTWLTTSAILALVTLEIFYIPLQWLWSESLLDNLSLSLLILEATALLTLTFGRLIGQLLEANHQLYIMATTDTLTGLCNRRTFTEKSTTLVELGQRYNNSVAVALFDIDHFKQINDTFGHAAGDEALRVFAAVLQVQARCVDVVGRLGGEEFGILMPETDLTGAIHIAERLRQEIETARITAAGEQFNMTTSVGVTTLHQADTGLQTLLARADRFLYKAKAMGRNQVVAENVQSHRASTNL